LDDWNRTAVDYPRDQTVHALFAAQAARTPDAVALIAGARALTYAELDRRANRLAHALRRRGVGREAREAREAVVGLCLERSPELVIGKLGILKAGAACLPMSAGFPPERIAYLLADADAQAVLAVRSTLDRIPPGFRAVLCLDAEPDLTAGMPAHPPDLPVLPIHLSYVIHTSGSTGAPKGVLITHRGVVRNLMADNPFSFRGDDTVLQYAPVTFDAATYEIFGTLLVGAKLAIAPAGDLSLAELGDHLGRAAVSAAWLTAALFHQMVEYRLDDLQGLRKIVSGGESLSVRHVQKVLRELPGCELVNGYGPTENTMFSNAFPVRALEEGAANVPIGRPVANCTAYVVDRDFDPLPVGEEGEVYVGGDGLARGYLGLPERTAEKFVPDPFGGRPGERLYRSGDLGRRLPGGEIEFLGRIDRLVKILGFRVELGEIEAALASHPEVGECVVAALPDPATGHRRLVAYYVARTPCPPGALRAYLKDRLPETMLPGLYVPLERLPVTPNGKVDHRALPNPGRERPPLAAAYVSPRSAVERELVGIWQEVLGFDRIGVHDDFFELGGNPLLGTLVVTQVHERFGLPLPLRSFLERATVAALASLVEAGASKPGNQIVAGS